MATYKITVDTSAIGKTSGLSIDELGSIFDEFGIRTTQQANEIFVVDVNGNVRFKIAECE